MALSRLVSKVGSVLRSNVRVPLTTYRQQHSYLAQDLDGYRSLISIEGVDSAKFIQNLITNDITNFDLLNNVEHKSMYAMILNNRGRIMYDVLLYKPDVNLPNYLLELDSKKSVEAMRFLSTFKIKKQESDQKMRIFNNY